MALRRRFGVELLRDGAHDGGRVAEQAAMIEALESERMHSSVASEV